MQIVAEITAKTALGTSNIASNIDNAISAILRRCNRTCNRAPTENIITGCHHHAARSKNLETSSLRSVEMQLRKTCRCALLPFFFSSLPFFNWSALIKVYVSQSCSGRPPFRRKIPPRRGERMVLLRYYSTTSQDARLASPSGFPFVGGTPAEFQRGMASCIYANGVM